MTLVSSGCANPQLSVVMVTHGSWQLTKKALAALIEHTEPPFELIVVDNHSDDETPARLSELCDARVIFNRDNRGFGPATNQGAEHARAEHLLLLNTDVFVHPGWLEPLRQTLLRPNVGAVVPRFLHPDGSLQEAGALLAQDGTVLVYGDGDDPQRRCYRFRRDIDFGGAACMLVRRSALLALGGFDEAYAPAYYEDADLCMRLAQRDLRVVYEPRSTVTHVRYGSGTKEAAAQLSERNRRRFVELWSSRLIGRPRTFSNSSPRAVIVARDAPATPRVLICAPRDTPGAWQLTLALLDRWPRARVTWSAGSLADFDIESEAWLERGIELMDEDLAWLDDRLFHYDIVIEGSHRFRLALERTQPQAALLSLNELSATRDTRAACLTSVLAAVGIAPQRR
jgi:GT2 family glycosyltransferase